MFNRLKSLLKPDSHYVHSKPVYDYELVETQLGSGHGLVVTRLADGQRLSWRTLPKSDGLEAINVVGASYQLAALQLDAFAPGSSVLIMPEPDNQYDSNAIAVYDKTGKHKVGYLPAEDCPRILKKMNESRFACLSMWETVKDGERKSLRILLIDGQTIPRIKDLSS